MSQCLLARHRACHKKCEGLSLDPNIHAECLAWWQASAMPALGRLRQEDPGSLLASVTHPASEFQFLWEALSQEPIDKDTWQWPLASAWTWSQACVHISVFVGRLALSKTVQEGTGQEHMASAPGQAVSGLTVTSSLFPPLLLYCFWQSKCTQP